VPGSVSVDPSVAGDIAILLLTACGLAVILALTARRTRVAPATLALGAGAGVALGVVMYVVAPLGLNFKYPDRPWLPGAAIDTFTALAWILVIGAPSVAGFLAGRRCQVPDDPAQAGVVQAWQGFAAEWCPAASAPCSSPFSAAARLRCWSSRPGCGTGSTTGST